MAGQGDPGLAGTRRPGMMEGEEDPNAYAPIYGTVGDWWLYEFEDDDDDHLESW